MGALPKRKISRVRRDQRRSHFLRVTASNVIPCPQCHTLKLGYHVCPNCGTYDGVEVVAIKEAKKS